MVRQGTELGVARFLPLKTRRCDVKVLSDNKRARLQRVAKEAAKQSGRSVVPEVGEMMDLGGLGVPASGLGFCRPPHRRGFAARFHARGNRSRHRDRAGGRPHRRGGRRTWGRAAFTP